MNKYYYLFLLIIVIVAGLFIKISFIGYTINNGILLTNTLDFSWQTDIIERLLHGYIAGKDFIFTYGPLYQFLTSIPALLFHIPSYTSYLSAQIILLVLVWFIFLFIIKHLAISKPEEILFFCLFIIVTISTAAPSPSDLLRDLSPFVFAILYFQYTLNSSNWFKKIFILALPAFLGLYTYDLFLLCVLLVTIIFAYNSWLILRKAKKEKVFIICKKNLSILLIHLLIIFCFEILTSFIISRNFNYIMYSLDTVRNYQYIMNIPWTINTSSFLLLFPLGLILAYIFFLRLKNISSYRKNMVTIVTITAILSLKAGFIRSDETHILMAVYPSILALILLLYFISKQKKLIILPLIIICIILTYKQNYFQSISLHNFQTTINNQNKDFFSIYKFPSDYYFSKDDFATFSELIKKNPHNVMVYPYDSFLLNINTETYNTLPLQFYQYANSPVEKDAIKRLQISPPKYIILGIDEKGAVMLDSIPNFSRNPLIAKWILTNYSVEKNGGNYLLLKLKGKKTATNKTSCDMFDFDAKNILKPSLLDNFGKPSTYYLITDKKVRLPYSPDNQNLFFIKDSQQIEKLFNQKNDFANPHQQIKNLTVRINYAIPGFKQTIKQSILVKCF